MWNILGNTPWKHPVGEWAGREARTECLLCVTVIPWREIQTRVSGVYCTGEIHSDPYNITHVRYKYIYIQTYIHTFTLNIYTHIHTHSLVDLDTITPQMMGILVVGQIYHLLCTSLYVELLDIPG